MQLMRQLKKGIRVLGVDDSPFTRQDETVLVVGVVERDGIIEGVLSTRVERDGDDATEKISEMVKRSRFLPEIRGILLNSVMMAGFNAVDIKKLSEETGKPVIAVVRRKPDAARTQKALENAPNAARKRERLKKAGPPKRFYGLYAQIAGVREERAAEFLRRRKGVPEAIRLAHIIAGGVRRGESRGKA